jgi:uncharacterized membrane protein required for colicin V production
LKEFISRLTWVDYIAFVVCIRGIYVGYKSGFFPELLRIASYIVTVIVAFRFHELLGQWLALKTLLNVTMASMAAFVLILVVTFFLTLLIRKLLLKMLKVGQGGFFARLVGALLGACRWVLLLSLFFMLVDCLPLLQLREDIHKRSLTGPVLSQVAPTMFDFLSSVSPDLALSKKMK